jgi:hypothetical protein
MYKGILQTAEICPEESDQYIGCGSMELKRTAFLDS